jgi:phosphoribosyl 1,2-cyclic phosphodiesterase
VDPKPPEQRPLPFGGPAPDDACCFASLGSGSRGNGTVVRFGSTTLLVDCGFTLKQTTLRLARLGLDPSHLTAVLVTHEHSDHIAGVGTLARRYNLPVHLTRGTLGANRARLADWGDLDLQPFRGGQEFEIAGVGVCAVPVPHDAQEPVQYLFEGGACRLGVVTDLGHVTPVLLDRFSRLDGLLIESNHDLEMLQMGTYPPHLKRRVGGSHGHLNNAQALSFVTTTAEPERTRVVVGHISEQNNCPRLLERLYASVAPRLGSLQFASQSHGTAWVNL